MSYSFNVRGATKAEAMEKVVAELDKVVAAQPVHSADRAQAQAAAEAFIGLIPDSNENQEVAVTASGWVSWDLAGSDTVVKAASANVSASLVAKEKA